MFIIRDQNEDAEVQNISIGTNISAVFEKNGIIKFLTCK
jgi:hypothetical protein